MSISELRIQLHQFIDTVNDSEKLQAVYTLLKGSESPYKSMSLQEYIDAIEQARAQVKEGDFTSQEELEKESESW